MSTTNTIQLTWERQKAVTRRYQALYSPHNFDRNGPLGLCLFRLSMATDNLLAGRYELAAGWLDDAETSLSSLEA